MSDLIERQDAINALSRGEGCGNICRRLIQHIPTVEAEPVRHGKWIHGREVCREYMGITLLSVQYEHWKCSACGYRTEREPLWKYCPNCGAKMDEEDE